MKQTDKRPLRVLMVEDVPEDAILIKRELSLGGFEVSHTLVSTEEELRAAMQRGPWDLVLCDYRLPRFSGAAALRVVRAQDGNVPIIIVSGSIGEEAAVAAMRAGACDYVMKDHLPRLVPAVERELRDAATRREALLAEEALRASEDRFRQVADNIDEVFWLMEVEAGRFVYVSPAYQLVWGRTVESLYERPQSWIEAVHKDDRERVLAAFPMKMTGDYDIDYRIVRPDNKTRWIHSRAVGVRDTGGRLCRIAGISEDITDRRELEERLRQSQKLEAIGQLAGGIAHDFNNILAIIRMQGDALLGESSLEPSVQEGLKEILEAVDRGKAMTSQLLTFSRRQIMADKKDLDLAALLRSMAKLLERTLGNDIRIANELPPSLPLIHADASMMEQVLMNLVINARDAMQEGGTVRITAEEVMIDKAYSSLHPQARDGRYVCLRVSDTGCGISPDDLKRIFEPFFTTKAEGKGTGLGLATVFGIVRHHHGWIDVESELGAGSCFSVFLPALPLLPERQAG
jgi:PAS domain S-box-containing protein